MARRFAYQLGVIAAVIFRVHRILDDPTIFNQKGGVEGDINFSSLFNYARSQVRVFSFCLSSIYFNPSLSVNEFR